MIKPQEQPGMFWIGDSKKKLEKKYQQLMAESYKLSWTDRAQADMKMSEADRVLKEIQALEQNMT